MSVTKRIELALLSLLSIMDALTDLVKLDEEIPFMTLHLLLYSNPRGRLG
jgi:hypothetical protein